MSEFKRVEHATYSPTVCLTCNTHAGPFIDTEIDQLAYGHIWLCLPCVRQMGTLAGMLDGTERDFLIEQIQLFRAEADRLRDQQVVPLADVMSLLARPRSTRAKSSTPA